MTKEQFAEALKCALRAHRERCPRVQAEDIVKFAFQGFLGMGHLLSDPALVEKRIAEEMRQEQAAREEALTEDVSPAWCRLNLRRAKAEGLTPRTLSKMMFLSGDSAGFTREDVIRFCRTLSEEEKQPELLAEALLLRDVHRLPSHSGAYRRAYHPAYRVVSASWRPLLPAVCAILEKQAEDARTLVTVDGPCASGKTTLARRLAEILDCGVVHTDDFVVPHRQKTPDRLAVPGGNCDWERLTREVIGPWKGGSQIRVRKYDWNADCLKPPEQIRPGRLLILEGSYCNLPPIRKYADLRLFVKILDEIRFERLKRRESPESLERFRERWIPLEDAYFEHYGLPDRGCLILADTAAGDGKAFEKPQACLLGHGLSQTPVLIDPKDKPDPAKDLQIDAFCDALEK